MAGTPPDENKEKKSSSLKQQKRKTIISNNNNNNDTNKVQIRKMDRSDPCTTPPHSPLDSSFSSSTPIPESTTSFFSSSSGVPSTNSPLKKPTSPITSPHSSSPFPFLPSSTKKWLKDKEDLTGSYDSSVHKAPSSGNITASKKKKSTPSSNPNSPPSSFLGEDSFFLPVAHRGNSSQILNSHNHLLCRCLIDHLLSCTTDCLSPPPSSFSSSSFSSSSPSPFSTSSPAPLPPSPYSPTSSTDVLSSPPPTPPFSPSSPYKSLLASSPPSTPPPLTHSDPSSPTPFSPSSPTTPPPFSSSSPPPFLDPSPIGWERKIDSILEIHSNPLAVMLSSLELEMAFEPHLAAVMRERTISVRCLQYLCGGGERGGGGEGVGEVLDGVVGPLRKFVGGLGKGKVGGLDGSGERDLGKKKKKEEKKDDGKRVKLKGKLIKALWQVLNVSALPPILPVICYEASALAKKWYKDFGKENTEGGKEEGKEGKEGKELGGKEGEGDAWAEWAVGAILLLRCLVPRITSKKSEGKKGKGDGMGLSETRRAEILISKFLIRLCSGTPFPNENCLLNEILEEVRPQFFVFCGEVIERGRELSCGGFEASMSSPETRKLLFREKRISTFAKFTSQMSSISLLDEGEEEEGEGEEGEGGVEKKKKLRKRSSTDILNKGEEGKEGGEDEGETTTGKNSKNQSPYDSSRGRSASLLAFPTSEEGEKEGEEESPSPVLLRHTPSNPASSGGGEGGGDMVMGWGGVRRRVGVAIPSGMPSFLLEHKEMIGGLLERTVEKDREMVVRREKVVGEGEGGKGEEEEGGTELLGRFIHCIVPEGGRLILNSPEKRRRERK